MLLTSARQNARDDLGQGVPKGNGPRETFPRAVTSTPYRMHSSEQAFADDHPVYDGGVPGGTFTGT